MALQGLRFVRVLARRALRLLVVVLAASPAATGTAAAPTTVEYLHIEANAGGSSGGHTAMCFERACFHYQQGDEGLLRLHREHPQQLDHGYRVIGNRTIHAIRIELSPDDHDRLLGAFEDRYRVERTESALLVELTRDVETLELATAAARGDSVDTASLHVPGTAYVEPDAPNGTGAAASRVTAEVRRRAARRYGSDHLARLRARVDTAITALDLDSAMPLPAPRELAPAPVWRGPARRLRDLLAARTALDALEAGVHLRDGAYRTVAGAAPLDATDKAYLERWSASLTDSLVRLLSARRADWGYPTLVAIARLLAVGESLRSGRLVVLDVHARSAPALGHAEVRAAGDALTALRAERHADLARERRRFFAADAPEELLWSRLELTANLAAELDAAAGGRAIRVPPERPLPGASVRRSDWPLPVAAPERAERSLAAARERRRRYTHDLRELYAYDLVSRNCATQIAHVTASVLGDGAPHGPLDFVPFVSARSLRRAGTEPATTGVDGWRVVATEERPSYRRMALAAMRTLEPAARVVLRESTPLTAHAYTSNPQDPAFMFFTDEAPALRPVLGAVNVASGLAAGVAGLATAPFDGGRRLRRGLYGALFAVPELAFVNLRKGTYPLAPRAWLEPTAR